MPADPAWPSVDWQLSLGPPSAARVIDSYRIAVRPTPGELQVYKGARWAKTPTDMLQDALLRTLEDSGRIGAVARQGTGVAADYKLVLDLRRFEADYAGSALPAATIEVNAKLLHAVDQDIVASRTFLRAEPAAGTDVAQVSDAFTRSLGQLSHDIAGWVLVTGAAHDGTAHP
jgi:cholesterol transport system auxiliary component